MRNVSSSEWFAQWFDSPYYHILYKFRDSEEAQKLIDNISTRLAIPEGAKLMDLACGKGRHSIYMNTKGYDVTGLDLSKQSIQAASQKANDTLHFAVHDMREVYEEGTFDYVFNLFTSFGYFDADRENQRVIEAIQTALKPGGQLILDFLNADKIIDSLVPVEVKEINGITFQIRRTYRDRSIIKEIAFEDAGVTYNFEEKVNALRLSDFERYFNATGLQIIHTFGDYDLNPYSEHRSDRLILVAQKQ